MFYLKLLWTHAYIQNTLIRALLFVLAYVCWKLILAYVCSHILMYILSTWSVRDRRRMLAWHVWQILTIFNLTMFYKEKSIFLGMNYTLQYNMRMIVNPGGYLNLVLVGMCRHEIENRPIQITIFFFKKRPIRIPIDPFLGQISSKIARFFKNFLYMWANFGSNLGRLLKKRPIHLCSFYKGSFI